MQLLASIRKGGYLGTPDVRIYCRNPIPAGEHIISLNGDIHGACGLLVEMVRRESIDNRAALNLIRDELRKAQITQRLRSRRKSLAQGGRLPDAAGKD